MSPAFNLCTTLPSTVGRRMCILRRDSSRSWDTRNQGVVDHQKGIFTSPYSTNITVRLLLCHGADIFDSPIQTWDTKQRAGYLYPGLNNLSQGIYKLKFLTLNYYGFPSILYNKPTTDQPRRQPEMLRIPSAFVSKPISAASIFQVSLIERPKSGSKKNSH